MRTLNKICLFHVLVLASNKAYGWTKPKPLSKRHGSVKTNHRSPAKAIHALDMNAKASPGENTPPSPSLLSKVKDSFGKPEREKLIKASTSGLAVSLAMVPEAVAFAFVAGVNPLVGLWTTVVLGFTAAALGGRPGICSSASGA